MSLTERTKPVGDHADLVVHLEDTSIVGIVLHETNETRSMRGSNSPFSSDSTISARNRSAVGRVRSAVLCSHLPRQSSTREGRLHATRAQRYLLLMGNLFNAKCFFQGHNLPFLSESINDNASIRRHRAHGSLVERFHELLLRFVVQPFEIDHLD